MSRLKKEEMISFLKNHFRYHTANSWNNSTSYAVNIKISDMDIPWETKEKLFDLMECEDAFDDMNAMIGKWSKSHDYNWQPGTNGRSGGYLVLYQGTAKPSGYKSYCMCCGQKNYKSTAESGNICGRCGCASRVDYEKEPITLSVYPGRSIDMDEDFVDWTYQEVLDRYRLVKDFDKLAEDILASAAKMAEEYTVGYEEKIVRVPAKKMRRV